MTGPEDGPTLRQVAAAGCKTIDIGTAIMPTPLFRTEVVLEEDFEVNVESESNSAPSQYAQIVATEFNAVVIEHHMKWAPICISEPGPLPGETVSDRLGRYDFDHADSMVDWALDHNLKVKGHVLVWSVTSPSFLKDLEPMEIRKQLKRHIFTMMAHFRGRIRVWDVVNEPLAPDGSLAENVFLQKLGPSYIEEAFRWAHEADPKSTLILNENKVEGIGTAKGDRFYELVADLKAKDVPVHAIGLQAHFNAAGVGRQRPPTPRMVKEQIHRLGDLGLSVHISEMDVRVSELPADVRQMAQRQIYHDITAAALSESAFDGIWLWGFTDRHTWVTHFYYDDEPLVFDEDYGRKEAYYGLRAALQTLCPDGCVGGSVLLNSDVDIHGNAWGHLWMQPEPGTLTVNGRSGDARPDWEQVPPPPEEVSGEDEDDEDDVETGDAIVKPDDSSDSEDSEKDGIVLEGATSTSTPKLRPIA